MTLIIVPDSEMDLGTDGFNPRANRYGITDDTLIPFDTTNGTVYVTAHDRIGNQVLAQTALSFVRPGVWKYRTSASVFLAGAGPWSIVVQLFDETGSSGSLLRTWPEVGEEA